jgi:hypothetical protein
VRDLCRFRRRTKPEGLAGQKHGMRSGDGAVVKPLGKSPL